MKPKSFPTSRRQFIGAASLATSAAFLGFPALVRGRSPNEQLAEASRFLRREYRPGWNLA